MFNLWGLGVWGGVGWSGGLGRGLGELKLSYDLLCLLCFSCASRVSPLFLLCFSRVSSASPLLLVCFPCLCCFSSVYRVSLLLLLCFACVLSSVVPASPQFILRLSCLLLCFSYASTVLLLFNRRKLRLFICFQFVIGVVGIPRIALWFTIVFSGFRLFLFVVINSCPRAAICIGVSLCFPWGCLFS